MDLIDYINTLSKEAALNDYDKLISLSLVVRLPWHLRRLLDVL